jgi:hypothetical protein
LFGVGGPVEVALAFGLRQFLVGVEEILLERAAWKMK